MKLICRALFLCCFTSAVTPLFADKVTFPAPNIPNLKYATLIGPTNKNKAIELTLWFKLRNKKLFDDTLQEISSSNNKNYHHYLSKQEFDSKFLLTNENVKSIKNYFTHQRLTVVPAKTYHFYLSVKGTVAQIENAFHIKINDYRYQNKIFYASINVPQIEQRIAPFILQITGLNNFPYHSSADVGNVNKCTADSPMPVTQSTDSQQYGLTSSFQANLQGFPKPVTFTGFILGGPTGHGYTPAQIQKAYGVDTLLQQNINGAGQRIKIIDSCISPTLKTDFNAFQCNNNMIPATSPECTSDTPSPLLKFHPALDGSTNYCTDGVAIAEVTLDVEGSHTMAPGAEIMVYWDRDWQSDTQNNLSVAKALTDAVDDSDTWGLISSSHSVPEKLNGFVNIDQVLGAAYIKGVSVNISSGDCGDNIGFTGSLQVNYPSNSPLITSVGATQLFADNDGNYLSETGWGTALNISYDCLISSGGICTNYTPAFAPQSSYAQGFVEGTTGGLADTYFSAPWQRDKIRHLYAGGYGVVGSKRAVPDISIFGESHYPGFECYVTPQTCSSPPCQPTKESEGGTSLATPFFTGILALVNQERLLNGKNTGIGLAAQYLYDLSACPSNCPLRPVNNPHGMGNPVAGLPNPNAFQLYQISNPTYSNLNLYGVVFNWDSTLTLGADGDRWNDVTGVGTPYAPVFVTELAKK